MHLNNIGENLKPQLLTFLKPPIFEITLPQNKAVHNALLSG